MNTKKKTSKLNDRDKFLHFSNIRMKKLENVMKSVGNLANTRYYEYTSKEKDDIKKDLRMWYLEMIGMWEKDWDKKGVVKSKEKLGYWDEKKNRE